MGKGLEANRPVTCEKKTLDKVHKASGRREKHTQQSTYRSWRPVDFTQIAVPRNYLTRIPECRALRVLGVFRRRYQVAWSPEGTSPSTQNSDGQDKNTPAVTVDS